jgi:hypothetical protein
MKTKIILGIFTTVLGCAAIAACSSDKSSGGGGGSPEGGNPATDCHTPANDPKYPTKNCDNAADRCFLLAHQPDVTKFGGQCAVSPACIGNASDPTSPAAVQCIQTCIDPKLQQADQGKLSTSCDNCVAAVVACGAKYCLNECITDPSSAPCVACLCKNHTTDAGTDVGNCMQDAFAQCAGFRPTDAQVACPAQ